MSLYLPPSLDCLSMSLAPEASGLSLYAVDASMDEIEADAAVRFYGSDYPSATVQNRAEAFEENSHGKQVSVYYFRQTRSSGNPFGERISTAVYHALLRAGRAGAKSIVIDAATEFHPSDEAALRAVVGGISAYAHAIVADRIDQCISEVAIRAQASAMSLLLGGFNLMHESFGVEQMEAMPDSGTLRQPKRSDDELKDTGEKAKLSLADFLNQLLTMSNPWPEKLRVYSNGIARAIDINDQLLRLPWYADSAFSLADRVRLCIALRERVQSELARRGVMPGMQYSWDLTEVVFDGQDEPVSLIRPLQPGTSSEWNLFKFLMDDQVLQGIDAGKAAESAAIILIEEEINEAWRRARSHPVHATPAPSERWDSPLQHEIASFLNRQERFYRIADRHRTRWTELFSGIIMERLLDKTKVQMPLDVILQRAFESPIFDNILVQVMDEESGSKKRGNG